MHLLNVAVGTGQFRRVHQHQVAPLNTWRLLRSRGCAHCHAVCGLSSQGRQVGRAEGRPWREQGGPPRLVGLPVLLLRLVLLLWLAPLLLTLLLLLLRDHSMLLLRRLEQGRHAAGRAQ